MVLIFMLYLDLICNEEIIFFLASEFSKMKKIIKKSDLELYLTKSKGRDIERDMNVILVMVPFLKITL